MEKKFSETYKEESKQSNDQIKQKINILKFKDGKGSWETGVIQSKDKKMILTSSSDSKSIELSCDNIIEMEAGLKIIDQICYKNDMVEDEKL